MAEEEAPAPPEPIRLGVGKDGSKLSAMALDFAINMVKRREVAGDSITALHVKAHSDKAHLVPEHLSHAHLKQLCVDKTLENHGLEVSWFEEERDPTVSTGEMLCKLVLDSGIAHG